MSEETGPREAAYDEHIAPLMTEIIRLSKEHKIPCFATFVISEPGIEGDGMRFCTTQVPNEAGPPFNQLLPVIRRRNPIMVAMTIFKEPT